MELRTPPHSDATPARRTAALGVAALAAAAAVASFAPPLAAQDTPWRVASVRMEAVLDTVDGSASVELRWMLVAAEPGAALPLEAAIPLELLGFGDAAVDEVDVGGAGPVPLERTHGTHRAASVRAPAGSSGPWLEMTFSYRAERVLEEDGPSIRLRLPVLTGPPVVGGESGGVELTTLEAMGVGPVGFSVALAVPGGWRVSDGFPTGLGRGDDGRLHAALATAPAMIGMRARTDGRWTPGLPLLVDVLALSVLAAFALRGWLHLRGVVADRRGPGAELTGAPVGGEGPA